MLAAAGYLVSPARPHPRGRPARSSASPTTRSCSAGWRPGSSRRPRRSSSGSSAGTPAAAPGAAAAGPLRSGPPGPARRRDRRAPARRGSHQTVPGTSSADPLGAEPSAPRPARSGAIAAGRPSSTGGRCAAVVHRSARLGSPASGAGRRVVGMTADITLRGPGDVVAVLPYQLGYHPRDSVVVVSLRGQRVGPGRPHRPPARRARRRGRGSTLVGPLRARRRHVGHRRRLRGRARRQPAHCSSPSSSSSSGPASTSSTSPWCATAGATRRSAPSRAARPRASRCPTRPTCPAWPSSSPWGASPLRVARRRCDGPRRARAVRGARGRGAVDVAVPDAASRRRRVRGLGAAPRRAGARPGASRVGGRPATAESVADLALGLADIAWRDGLIAWLAPGVLPADELDRERGRAAALRRCRRGAAWASARGAPGAAPAGGAGATAPPWPRERETCCSGCSALCRSRARRVPRRGGSGVHRRGARGLGRRRRRDRPGGRRRGPCGWPRTTAWPGCSNASSTGLRLPPVTGPASVDAGTLGRAASDAALLGTRVPALGRVASSAPRVPWMPVMSPSAKPRFAGRQPSSRWGAPGDDLAAPTRCGKRESEEHLS